MRKNLLTYDRIKQKMNHFRNSISKLYDAVRAPVAATRNVFKEIIVNKFRMSPWQLEYIPDKYKTQEMCEEFVSEKAWCLVYVPNEYKTRKMCEQAFKEDDRLFIPDWFITAEMVEKYKGEEERFKAYKQRKAQKQKSKKNCYL